MDVYSIVTERIVKSLEHGNVPWLKPWVGVSFAWNRKTGKAYSLLNQFLLGETGEFASFKQINAEKDGKVNKGAEGRLVTFWKMYDSKTEKDKDGNPKKVPVLKYYTVFNIANDTNLEVKHHKELMKTFDTAPIEEIDALIKSYTDRSGLKIVNEKWTDKAYYSPSEHAVHLPNINQFKDASSYYSTLFHELIHSTGHKSMLNRFEKGNTMFGSDVYSKEELVAEIGTACVLNRLGIETDFTMYNNKAYINNWASHIKADKKMIVHASSKAEKAVKLIFNELDDKEKNDDATEMVASVA